MTLAADHIKRVSNTKSRLRILIRVLEKPQKSCFANLILLNLALSFARYSHSRNWESGKAFGGVILRLIAALARINLNFCFARSSHHEKNRRKQNRRNLY